MANTNLHSAKKAKNDEFYTQYADIEKELNQYLKHNPKLLHGKKVYLNCDSAKSNFWLFFVDNYSKFGLSGLVATSYTENQNSVMLSFDGHTITETQLDYDGDFRNPQSIELLKECDFVFTNPPFSLFRESIDLLISSGKHFAVIGSKNAITYKNVFGCIKDNQLWLGKHLLNDFELPSNSTAKHKVVQVVNQQGGVEDKKIGCAPALWFTNINYGVRNEYIQLTKPYNQEDYPTYDNYDAINVDTVKDIPCDYFGVMGVPITFLTKYNPEQFELVKFRKGDDDRDLRYLLPNGQPKETYFRILIKRKQ